MKKILVLTVLLTMVFSIAVFAEEASDLAKESADISIHIVKHAEIDFNDRAYSTKPKDYLTTAIPFTLETNTPVSLSLTSAGFKNSNEEPNSQLNSWIEYHINNNPDDSSEYRVSSALMAGEGTVNCNAGISNGRYNWSVAMVNLGKHTPEREADSEWWNLESDTYTDQLTLTVVPTE